MNNGGAPDRAPAPALDADPHRPVAAPCVHFAALKWAFIELVRHSQRVSHREATALRCFLFRSLTAKFTTIHEASILQHLPPVPAPWPAGRLHIILMQGVHW